MDAMAEPFLMDVQPKRAFGMETVGMTKIFGALTALDDVSIRIEPGEFHALLGENGAGKSTLVKCIMGFYQPTRGQLLVNGREALILPCLGRTEIDLQAGGLQAVTVEDSMSMVHLSSGMNAPASRELLSEPAIVARLGAAALPDCGIAWLELVADYDRIRERIARVVPGFEDFNARVRAPGGFHLHHPCRERVFPTHDGKARFFVHALVDGASTTRSAPKPLLQLMTVRSHDQYNTTVYSANDRYRGVHGLRRVCFISRADLDAHSFNDGDHVDLVSVWDDGERIAHDFRLIEYDIPAGCLASYFPETNALVPLAHHAGFAQVRIDTAIGIEQIDLDAGVDHHQHRQQCITCGLVRHARVGLCDFGPMLDDVARQPMRQPLQRLLLAFTGTDMHQHPHQQPERQQQSRHGPDQAGRKRRRPGHDGGASNR